jgi:hypothetical protein
LLTTIFKDLGVGERIKMAELRNLIDEDPAYQNISTELEDEMKQVVLEHCELKKVGARPSIKSASAVQSSMVPSVSHKILFIYLPLN